MEILGNDGNNWEDAVIKADDGIHINWPNSYYTTGWWAEPGETKKNKDYQNKIKKLEKIFAKAKSLSSPPGTAIIAPEPYEINT